MKEENKEIEVTKEDLKNNPEFKEEGIKEGDKVELGEEVVELSPEEEKLQELYAKRTGNFKVTLGYKDAVYLRNILDKAEFKGPQQAYLLVISKLEMSTICSLLQGKDASKRYEVELTSSVLESLNFFMGMKTGKGEEAAQKLFAAHMLLRQALTELSQVDEEIQLLKTKM